MHGTVKKNKRKARWTLASSEANRRALLLQLQESNLRATKLSAQHREHTIKLERENAERVREEADHAQMLMQQIEGLENQLNGVRTENWQLKGALGYKVPGHIREGDFKCGLCDAKTNAVLEMERRWEEIDARMKLIAFVVNHGEPK